MKKISGLIFSFCIVLSVPFSTQIVVAQSISLPGQQRGKFADHHNVLQQQLAEKTIPDKTNAVLHSLVSTVVLDPAFGTNGSLRTFINGGKSSNKDDRATSVALQSDGKIVVAGRSEDDSYYYAFALTRFNRDGSLDSAFGNSGSKRNFISAGDIDDEANSIAVQSDGKIVAAGYSTDALGHIAFALARYDTAGNLDTTFGSHGTKKNNIKGGNSKSDYAYSVALQSDGKIVAAGRSGDASSNYAFELARYNTDGSIDSAFGTNGTTVNNIYRGGHSEDIINSVALQSDQKIIAAGQSMDSSGYYRGCALARYNTDGSLDNTFGTSGTVRNYISGGNSSNDLACSVVLQSDGKIVTAGWSEDPVGNAFFIARYTTDGNLDSSFNTTGTI